MELTYRQCTFENVQELELLLDLQNEVYKERGLHFEKEDFSRWYVDNPAGKVISFNAFDGDRMVAHQSFLPCFMNVGERVVKSARSMGVVTLPEYQGKGIFSKLTNMGVEYAKNQGYELLFAVTNANSYPGFIKHAGFKFVTRLQVKIGYGWNVTPNNECIYSNHWTSELLQWRLRLGEYSIKKDCIIGKFKPLVNTFMGRIGDGILEDNKEFKHDVPLGLHLYVGCGAKLNGLFVNMPKFVKHSPFNFIYRDLTGGTLPPITRDNLFYQLIDYDVA